MKGSLMVISCEVCKTPFVLEKPYEILLPYINNLQCPACKKPNRVMDDFRNYVKRTGSFN